MRLEIRYASQFTYPEPVRESHNVLRACPVEDDFQWLASYRVRTVPAARMVSYHDYWGTRVDAFGIRAPHRSLEVVAEAVVVTSPRPEPDDSAASLDAYTHESVALAHHQYLQRSPHASWGEALAVDARRIVAGATTALQAVLAVDRALGGILEYAPGATYVGVDVNEVHRQGKGVCQDFAHLAIAMYRSLGIPARYVSGYLYSSDQSVGQAPVEAEIEIQTHAWVEAFIPGWGWWALDPTNAEPVGERHVKIGHGRDYDDVLPLRGVYHGTADHGLGVTVNITREHLSAAAEQ